MRLELSARGRQDIERLHHDGAQRFGVQQAAHYTAGLFDLFDLILANPKMAAVRPAFSRQTRLIRYRSHVVLYRIEGEAIRIVRILHGKQDWMDHL
jgi:toxin ParE1/3/4